MEDTTPPQYVARGTLPQGHMIGRRRGVVAEAGARQERAEEIGAAAAKAVIRHLDNDLALPNAVALKPELIVRASVG